MKRARLSAAIWLVLLGAGVAQGAGAPASPWARGFPKVGQCYATRVKTVGTRLGTPDSGSVVSYTDRHIQIAYETSPIAQAFRPGDRVKLCVVSLPANCPPGDNRGVVYRALNARTGGAWKAADSQHSCGGA
ncbi:MAG: hypothetical protein ACREEB_17310 [Caulobacteraceae bacterium]